VGSKVVELDICCREMYCEEYWAENSDGAGEIIEGMAVGSEDGLS